MFESLFGAEMPLAVRFFVIFLVVLGVIGAIIWAIRRFGGGRLGTSPRGRQPRLAVIDYATVDNRRRLLLVRRDNVEHLLMIGGPSDIVVEPNIVRAAPASRDIGRAPAGIEALTRAIPLPENGGSWPLQPDANGGSRPPARQEPKSEDLPPRPQPEAGPRQRDTLAALADELSTRAPPTPTRNRGNVGEPPRQEQRQEPRQEPRQEARAEARPDARETRQEPRQEPRAEARPDARETRQEPRQEPRFEPRKPQQGIPPTPSSHATPASAETTAGADQSLADMAQRLEAALRKSPGEARPAGSPVRPAPSDDKPARSDSPPPPRTARPTEQKPGQAEADRPGQSKTAIYDSLEQEMANLLGRPSKS
jgi:flagellar protein FliO/FliZ